PCLSRSIRAIPWTSLRPTRSTPGSPTKERQQWRKLWTDRDRCCGRARKSPGDLQPPSQPAEPTGRVSQAVPPAPPQGFKRLQPAQQVAAEQPVELTQPRWQTEARDSDRLERSQPGLRGKLEPDPK